MLFTIPPSELKSYVLEKLSFSGLTGLTLTEMWSSIGNRLQVEALDSFQQQIVWQWLFFCNESDTCLQLYISKNSNVLTILPNYTEFILNEGPADIIRVQPTQDTQWRYLTGLEISKKLKVQLGEKPFQLLCEIAKYGAKGIVSPDLCKATGQDPRSLPSRFKKLEEMGYIVRKNVYHESSSQHTNLCIHSKFAKGISNSDITTRVTASRSSFELRQMIVQAVKEAPHDLRGFNDLKRELKLDSTKSASKYFGVLVEFLHKNGYVEKVYVKDEAERVVYSIKFIRDLPIDLDNASDYVELFGSNTISDLPVDDFGEKAEDESDRIPLFNNIFPITTQVNQKINSTRGAGTTAREIVSSLSGASSYRPWNRWLEFATSYAVLDNTLIPLKPYHDYYNDCCIIKAYDVEGKHKFYRYYLRGNHMSLIEQPNKLKRPEIDSFHDRSLKQLSMTYYHPLGKTPKGPFSKVHKRPSASIEVNTNNKKQKLEAVGKPSRKHTPRDDRVTEIAEPSLTVNFVNRKENLSTINEGSAELSKPRFGESVQVPNIAPIKPQIFTDIVKRTRKSVANNIAKSTLKGQRRREELLELIKDLGGVTYTTAKLCRDLDERLGNNTATDLKTVARDISILISNHVLESQNVSFARAGRIATRKLLILTNENLRPSDARVEMAREQCITDHGVFNYQKVDRRVIEGEVTLYLSARPSKVKPGKGRLDSLGHAPASRKTRGLRDKVSSPTEDNTSDLKESENTVTLPTLVSKKHRRRTKPLKRAIDKKASVGYRKFRTTYKFDKTDATTLFRAVVISKAFKRGSIDFSEIASLYQDMDVKGIKQKWTVVRKLVGGLPIVLKGVESFGQIVLKGIEDDLVSADDLENIKFRFFLDLWKDADNSVMDMVDKTPLYHLNSVNCDEYNRMEVGDTYVDIFDQLEDNSMRQKDATLAGITFYQDVHPATELKENEDLRTVLKAIFSTTEENFTPIRVRQILSLYGEEVTHLASSALIKDKEMLYYGSDDSNSRFVLTDKVYNAIHLKLPSRLFHQGSCFKLNLLSILGAQKGLILSQNILNGHVTALLHLIAESSVTLIHIDRLYQFEGYESRLIDKEKLSSDIVTIGSVLSGVENVSKIPVPTGKACSRLWLDLNGNINQPIWVDIITTVISFIHFRPGVQDNVILGRMQSALSHNDFQAVMQWLIDSNCIKKGPTNGYWTKSSWYSILGY